MITSPYFFDHWKTQLLISYLKDEAAPIYIQRLWAHCQITKKYRFKNLPNDALKSICHYQGDADRLSKAFVNARFIYYEDGFLVVHEWEIHNAGLINSWINGARSKGRPRKPTGNPRATRGQPAANPWQTHGEPIREEKIRLDKKKKKIIPVLTLQKWTPNMQRFANMFSRRRTTKFHPKEIAAIKKLEPIEELDMVAVESLYASKYEYKRNSLITLLNNFPSEVDKAEKYLREKRTTGKIDYSRA